MTVEHIHQYFKVANAISPATHTADEEKAGTAASIAGYSKALYIVNIGAMSASDMVFEVAYSGIGDSSWTSTAAVSGIFQANNVYLIDVQFAPESIAGYVRCEITPIEDTAIVDTVCVLYGGTHRNPPTQENDVQTFYG